MQAIILAAGMGRRLKELTEDSAKCMVQVNGVTLIERSLSALDKLRLTRIVLVTGYRRKKLKSFVDSLSVRTPIIYVDNPQYDQTNNIYSLYLAREYLLQDDTLLLESDLIFEDDVLRRLVEDPYPTLALVAPYQRWMDGTMVTLDEEDRITNFISRKDFDYSRIADYYKTVNIYKFGQDFSAGIYVPFLEAYCEAMGHNEYYEQVLKVIAYLDKPVIRAARLTDEKWYEIDDEQDLDIAGTIFCGDEERLGRIQARYGGYWRYPDLLDFCYLVNPFYPPKKLKEELKSSFDELLCQYPSGMAVNSLLAAKNFGLRAGEIIAGNGASELIKAVLERLPGKLGVILPTFEEYPNRRPDQITAFDTGGEPYTADDVMNWFDAHPVDILVLINPDNPTGQYLPEEEVLRMAAWAQTRHIRLIVDESFSDFTDIEGDRGRQGSLMDRTVLRNYPELLVVKSISKSHGVPGLRLGILAGEDTELISALKSDVSIWNINSFAEYYMQICEKYQSDYDRALERLAQTRSQFICGLRKIPGLQVYDSQANYVMCRLNAQPAAACSGPSASVTDTAAQPAAAVRSEFAASASAGAKQSYAAAGAETDEAVTEVTEQPAAAAVTAGQLSERLLNEYNILIKDLSGKKGLHGEYIRLAVRLPEENDRLIRAMSEILSGQ